MSRVLVITGASGLVGAELTAALLPRFDRVLALSRGAADLGALRAAVRAARPGGAEETRLLDRLDAMPVGELSRGALAARGIDEIAQVWNVAAELSYDHARLRETVAANTAAPLRLLDLCRPTERFFQISTVGVTGPGRRGLRRVIREEALWEVDAVNPYVVAKLMAEHLLDARGEATGHPVSSLRIGSVLGPAHRAPVRRNRAGYFTLAEMTARALRSGRPLSLDVDPAGTPPLLHVDDLAAACRELAERARTGAEVHGYYHLGDQRLTNQAAAAAVNAELGAEVLRIGEHRTALDRAHAAVNADNLAFMDCAFTFDRTVLESHLPPLATPRVNAASYAGFLAREVRGAGAATAARRAA
ncbi:NAD(P)-dependent oxidoreductase [Kitasatospora sp. GAS204B]|uniref:NAD-dependent epimerase/dehydratase family protein n=1 Tax=unclassified Kitasatospora TaxID=2633591 RepID=UPI002473CD72|nr:NAD(P)-dependent oxidoreductase [Kitasatospora sp. GAS204B]MDH6117264.1 nucleoside-diphosphate-sugar epimerase [Kitasatospora sp. GAS204B]